MLYIKKHCPFCKTGDIGFRMCSDGSTIVLMCDECESIWFSPGEIEIDTMVFSSPPEFLVPTLDCSALAGESRWATRDEVEAMGWAEHIYIWSEADVLSGQRN